MPQILHMMIQGIKIKIKTKVKYNTEEPSLHICKVNVCKVNVLYCYIWFQQLIPAHLLTQQYQPDTRLQEWEDTERTLSAHSCTV